MQFGADALPPGRYFALFQADVRDAFPVQLEHAHVDQRANERMHAGGEHAAVRTEGEQHPQGECSGDDLGSAQQQHDRALGTTDRRPGQLQVDAEAAQPRFGVDRGDVALAPGVFPVGFSAQELDRTVALNVLDETRFFQRAGGDGFVGQVLERCIGGQFEPGKERKERAKRQGHLPRVQQQNRASADGHDGVHQHREGTAHEEVADRGNRIETGQDGLRDGGR